MEHRLLGRVGYSEQEVIDRLNALGGTTIENIARVISENNDIVSNRVNEALGSIHNNLEKVSKR